MIKIQPNGAFTGTKSNAGVLRAFAQQHAALILSTAAVIALTDSSGGTADANNAIALPGTLSATEVDGTNLASKATSESAMTTVLDGLAEVMENANLCRVGLGMEAHTDNSGATTENNTVDAVTVSVTGAATGAQIDETNATRKELNNYMATVAEVVNSIASAVGSQRIYVSGVGDSQDPVTVKAAATGTAAAPAVSKADMDALLAVYANSIATLAARLTEAKAKTGQPEVLAV